VRVKDFDRPGNSASSTVNFNFQTRPVPPTSTVDIWPTAFEVTQALGSSPVPIGPSDYVQPNFDIDVPSYPPLIRGKYTLILVYRAALNTPSAVSHVPAQMSVYRENCSPTCIIDRYLPPVTSKESAPLMSGISLKPISDPNSAPDALQGDLKNTWDFLLYP